MPERPVRRFRRPSIKESLGFLYVWLMVGFAAGTFVLIAPVRWITGMAQAQGWSEGTENAVMIGVIVLYVVASFALALVVTRTLFQYRSRAFKYGMVLGITALAGSALWGWRNPAVYASVAGGRGWGEQTVATRSGAVFEFGPYPSRERLAELKAEGITAVVSLQHPSVVPFEPEGIEHEKAWTQELGMRLVQAPMLPWVSDNAASLEIIRKIATEETGRFYVHCGLGRDRVNVVRRMLDRMGAATEGQLVDAMDWQDRIEQGMSRMENGELQKLRGQTWLVPSPNDHELFGNMLAGQAGTVFLLLDPAAPEQSAALDKITGLLDQYGIDYRKRPLRAGDGATAQAIVDEVLREQGPVTIVAPETAPMRAVVAESFLEAWRAKAPNAATTKRG